MAVGRLLHCKIEPVARVQTEGIVIRNLNGGRGGSGTVNAFPLRGISYVSSHGFSNRWRPAHKRVTAASGVAVKSRCGAVLFDDADLVGKDFFVLHAVSVGDGAHQAVRSLERIVGSTRFSIILIIVSSAIFLLRPTSCPTIFLIAIIVPAGDLLAVTGQFPIAESKEIIAAVSCLIVVQSTSPGNGSTGRIHINAADRLIGRPVSLRYRLSPAVPLSVRFAPLSRAAQIIRLINL